MPAKLWEKIRLKGSIEQVFEKVLILKKVSLTLLDPKGT